MATSLSDARIASENSEPNFSSDGLDGCVDTPPCCPAVPKRKRGVIPPETKLRASIENSRSLVEAASKLELSVSAVRRHAKTLGIRSKFRLGKELLPSDQELIGLLQESAKTTGLSSLAQKIGVTPTLLAAKAAELGVDGRRAVRPNLPDDDTLRHLIRSCKSMRALALELGVEDYHIRNQARRLKVWPGQPAEPDRDHLSTKCVPSSNLRSGQDGNLGEITELFEIASQALTAKEVELERERLEKMKLEAEAYRLRQKLSLLERKFTGNNSVLVPKTMDQMIKFIKEDLGDHIVVLKRAIKATHKIKDLNYDRLYTALNLLRNAYVPMKRGVLSKEEYEIMLAEASFEETASLSNDDNLSHFGYQATWENRTVKLDRHLKWGRDPKRLVRVYFHYCDVQQIVVVGWMPTHLDNASTN